MDPPPTFLDDVTKFTVLFWGLFPKILCWCPHFFIIFGIFTLLDPCITIFSIPVHKINMNWQNFTPVFLFEGMAMMECGLEESEIFYFFLTHLRRTHLVDIAKWWLHQLALRTLWEPMICLCHFTTWGPLDISWCFTLVGKSKLWPQMPCQATPC